MPTPSLSDRLISPLRQLAAGHGSPPQTDGQLLTAFVSAHDPAAFEAIGRSWPPAG
jgi:hypothetical protein